MAGLLDTGKRSKPGRPAAAAYTAHSKAYRKHFRSDFHSVHCLPSATGQKYLGNILALGLRGEGGGEGWRGGWLEMSEGNRRSWYILHTLWSHSTQQAGQQNSAPNWSFRGLQTQILSRDASSLAGAHLIKPTFNLSYCLRFFVGSMKAWNILYFPFFTKKTLFTCC